MKISTKGRYLLLFLLDLAERKDEGYIALKDIAERQGISKKYMEQLVTLLNRSGILRTNRGAHGGYKLAKEPSEYTVGQILRITEKGLDPIACGEDDHNQCSRVSFCMTFPMWKELDRIINEYLDSVTLQTLLDDRRNQTGE